MYWSTWQSVCPDWRCGHVAIDPAVINVAALIRYHSCMNGPYKWIPSSTNLMIALFTESGASASSHANDMCPNQASLCWYVNLACFWCFSGLIGHLFAFWCACGNPSWGVLEYSSETPLKSKMKLPSRLPCSVVSSSTFLHPNKTFILGSAKSRR